LHQRKIVVSKGLIPNSILQIAYSTENNLRPNARVAIIL
jgi:hypothetical protein